MNDHSEFHLDQAIQQWRDKLSLLPSFRGENLDELEAHLRDSVAILQTRSLSDEEAFMIAQKRLGQVQDLEPEFRKMNQSAIWQDRILWMLLGLQVWMLISSFLGRIARGALMLVLGGYEFAVSHRVFSLAAFASVQTIVFLGSLALCWWLIIRKGHGLAGWFARFSTRPARVVLLGFFLWASSTMALGLAQVFQIWPERLLDPNSAGELSLSMTMATGWVQVLSPAVMIAMTLVLARKRLDLNRTCSAA